MWYLTPSTYSPARAAESLPTSCSDIELLAQSKSSHTPEKFCLPGSLTEAYLDSLFGMTSKISASTTQTHAAISNACEKGVGNSPFAAGSLSLARTSAQPGKAQESPESEAGFGEKWQELSVKYDLATSSWKTHQCLFPEGLPWYSVILPTWGMTRNGRLFQHQTLERPISAIASGFMLPTPVASDGTSGAIIGKNDTFYTTSSGMSRKVNQNGVDGSVGLGRLVQMWPTPRANDAEKRGNFDLTNRRNGLPGAVKLWPTPTANCSTGAGEQGREGGLNIQTAVKKFPTPCASDNRDRGNAATPAIKRRIENGKQVMLSMMVSNVSGQLSPDWVELLMGWPMGWTDLQPLPATVFEKWMTGGHWAEGWEDGVPRVGKGVANRVSRLKAIGNGQVPLSAATAWQILAGSL